MSALSMGSALAIMEGWEAIASVLALQKAKECSPIRSLAEAADLDCIRAGYSGGARHSRNAAEGPGCKVPT